MHNPYSHMKWKVLLLMLIAVLLIALLGFLPPIPQPAAYNHFADQRMLWGIPHFWNEVTNVPFIVIGILGLWYLMTPNTRASEAFHDPRERLFYVFFFGSLMLAAIGSTFYHWAPTNATLVWDRLPIALAMMSIFTAIIAERISVRYSMLLFLPLLVLAVGSVIYWHYTELSGAGDLRAFIFVQFYPFICIPVILFLFKSPYTRGHLIWAGLILYYASKFFEEYDKPVYQFLNGALSGHTLKHLFAAAATLFVLAYIYFRKPLHRF